MAELALGTVQFGLNYGVTNTSGELTDAQVSAILAEAVALGASGGLSRAAMMEVICESAVASPLLKYKTDLVVSADYVPAFTIDQMIKDFTLISDAGRANGIPLMAAGLILELYRAAANAGLQNEDFFALVKWQSGISAQ